MTDSSRRRGKKHKKVLTDEEGGLGSGVETGRPMDGGGAEELAPIKTTTRSRSSTDAPMADKERRRRRKKKHEEVVNEVAGGSKGQRTGAML